MPRLSFSPGLPETEWSTPTDQKTGSRLLCHQHAGRSKRPATLLFSCSVAIVHQPHFYAWERRSDSAGLGNDAGPIRVRYWRGLSKTVSLHDLNTGTDLAEGYFLKPTTSLPGGCDTGWADSLDPPQRNVTAALTTSTAASNFPRNSWPWLSVKSTVGSSTNRCA